MIVVRVFKNDSQLTLEYTTNVGKSPKNKIVLHLFSLLFIRVHLATMTPKIL